MKIKKYEVEVTDSNKNESIHTVVANNIAHARFVGRNLHILTFKYKNDKIPLINSIVTFIGEDE